jgi:prepilin-type processing-associated H-X9-DG protein
MGHRPGTTRGHTDNASRCKGVMDWLQTSLGYNKYTSLVNDIRSSKTLYYYYYMTLANSFLNHAGYSAGWTDWENTVFPGKLINLRTTVTIDGKQTCFWEHDLCAYGHYAGRAYTTALACLTIEAGNPGHWTPDRAMGQCSYGYNSLVGDSRRTPSKDTILAMDYNGYIIVRGIRDENGNLHPGLNDDSSKVALRHGGKANVLFADGTVRALGLSGFSEGMWTPEPGD